MGHSLGGRDGKPRQGEWSVWRRPVEAIALEGALCQYMELTSRILWLTLVIAVSHATAQERTSHLDTGRKLFNDYCAACHQYDDQRMGQAPPLAGSPWVNGPVGRLIRIVLHGVKGRMEVSGKVYDREMPGFGRTLSDEQVAVLIWYVRSRFGRNTEPVATSQIRAIRRASAGRNSYWSVEELQEVR